VLEPPVERLEGDGLEPGAEDPQEETVGVCDGGKGATKTAVISGRGRSLKVASRRMPREPKAPTWSLWRS
jgi:hypothetical protein